MACRIGTDPTQKWKLHGHRTVYASYSSLPSFPSFQVHMIATARGHNSAHNFVIWNGSNSIHDFSSLFFIFSSVGSVGVGFHNLFRRTIETNLNLWQFSFLFFRCCCCSWWCVQLDFGYVQLWSPWIPTHAAHALAFNPKMEWRKRRKNDVMPKKQRAEEKSTNKINFTKWKYHFSPKQQKHFRTMHAAVGVVFRYRLGWMGWNMQQWITFFGGKSAKNHRHFATIIIILRIYPRILYGEYSRVTNAWV